MEPPHDRSSDSEDQTELEEEVLALLREVGVTPRDLALSPEDQARVDGTARAALSDLVDRGAGVLEPSSPAAGLPRRRRWVLIALPAAVVVVVFMAIGVRTLGTQSDLQTATPPPLDYGYVPSGSSVLEGRAASESLRRLASLAAGSWHRSTGTVQRVRTVEWGRATDPVSGEAQDHEDVRATEVESFLLPDGTSRVVTRRGPVLDSMGRLDVSDLGKGDQTSNETVDGPPEGTDYPLRLPTNPRRLTYALLPDGTGCADMAYCLIARVEHLYSSYVMPHELGQTLWRALAVTGELRDLGEVTDRLGRSAIAFATPVTAQGRQLVIYADPATGSFLGTEELLVGDGSAPQNDQRPQAPAVMRFSALLDAEWVGADAVPEELG